MPGRNKSKKFLKEKQGNQKKRTKFATKSAEEIAKSNPELSTHSAVESFTIDLNSDDSNILNKITTNVNINEMMDECFENLEEKDTKMKLATLHRINRLLRESLECDEYLRNKSCDNLYRLLSLLKDCLYHENNKVQCLALETISLLMISLNDNHDIVEKLVYSTILKFIKKPRSIPVQIQSIKTLSVIAWTLNDTEKKRELITILSNIWIDQVSSEESTSQHSQPTEYNEEFLQALENSENIDNINELLIDSEDNKSNDDAHNSDEIDNVLKVSEDEKNELLIAAIETWSWLIASINNSESIGDLLKDYHEELLDILETNKDVSVRCAAGEALILLLSNYKSTMNNDDKDYNNNNDNTINIDNIDNIFYDLSEDHDKQRKNELKQQRIKFRAYLDTSENGKLPIVNIKLRGKEYEKEGWQIWIIYNRLKDILKEGFQLHLLKNELVQKAMDISDVEIVEQLTQSDKKSKLMTYADNAKVHKQKIKGQRKQKRAFMFEDGDG